VAKPGTELTRLDDRSCRPFVTARGPPSSASGVGLKAVADFVGHKARLASVMQYPSDLKRGSKQCSVHTALDQLRLRRIRIRILEDETHLRLEAIGFRVRSRIKPHDARFLGLPSLPGEVDHVAACPGGAIIWVIDDKDLAEAYTPGEIARGVVTFNKPGGEVEKLHAKMAAVAADTISVSTSLSLDGRKREVKGLFVTRRPVPAAFTISPPIEFTILDDLHSALGVTTTSPRGC
jgi:hypothetical protein